MTTIHIAATPLWQQLLAPVVGGGIGGGIAYLTAVRSLTQAAEQAGKAQRAEWAEARRAREEERAESRRAALLALNWELEVNQELLDRQQQRAKWEGIPALLPHAALDAALAWYRSLPDTARGTIHEAQLALVRYNVDAEYSRSALIRQAPGFGPSAAEQAGHAVALRGAVAASAGKAIVAFARARTELTKELAL